MTPTRKKEEEQQEQQLLLFLDVSRLTDGGTRQNDDQQTEKLSEVEEPGGLSGCLARTNE